MQQADLFATTPLARNTDPRTSHVAAARLEASGKLRAQQRQVLDALTRWPGSTAVEIATHSGLDRYLVSRRLPELAVSGHARRGRPRNCTIRGTAQTVWHPA